jgi:glycerol-3-phosphate dehydrogenase
MLDAVEKALKEAFPDAFVGLSVDARGILTLRGECESWARVVDIGHLAAKQPGVKNVVNELGVRGVKLPVKDYTPFIERGRGAGVVGETDALIIGAGVTGCGIARELSKYDISILVVEKEEDVSCGATKANNGHIHPGHAVKPGTLKAKLNVRGNDLYTKWAEELGFELQRCGAVFGVTNGEHVKELEFAFKIAKMNGVPGVEIVDGNRARELEPGFAERGLSPVAALYLPTYGLVEPYKVVVALAENAAANGARFWFDCTVADIVVKDGRVEAAVTSRGIVRAKYIINCAGVYADEISAMAGDKRYTIHPRKGTIAILDKTRRPMFNSLAGVADADADRTKNKNSDSKGGGMCRTPEGNVLMGPSATEVPDKEDLSSTPEDLAYAMSLARRDSNIVYGDIIRFFTGSRPAEYTEDFVIGMSDVTDGFINVGGIQSPGLAAAPAVAEMVEGIVTQAALGRGEPFSLKRNFNPIREREVEFRHLNREEQDELIRKSPRYGKVICRCENITEGEILDALASPVTPVSIDAIKRRTRAGMGRCQGGFCQPRVLEMLARELGRDWTEINLRGGGTNVLVAGNRPQVCNEGGDEIR